MPAPARSSVQPFLIKPVVDQPALKVISGGALAVRAGVVFGAHSFRRDTAVVIGGEGLVAGCDYGVIIDRGVPRAWRAYAIPAGDDVLGGFHFAPGGNATARAGGGDVPAINPCSLWDLHFRPACPDPRGMAFVTAPGRRRFWCDIYLTGQDCHRDGTSRFGVAIADGNACPIDPATGQRFRRFDYAAVCATLAAHGKAPLGLDDFPHAAFGVTERTAAKSDPKTTGLDAPRTSRFGLMQATGNMWVWGHDGDPDAPRASMFGGGWLYGDDAGSRYAYVAYSWPDDSSGHLGARGRSDHLQPASRRGSAGLRKAAA